MNAQEFAQKEQQSIQADLLGALNSQIEMAKNKLGYAIDSMALGEYSLANATEEMADALGRIEVIDKLAGLLILITQQQAPSVSHVGVWRPIGELCRDVIENLEAMRVAQ